MLKKDTGKSEEKFTSPPIQSTKLQAYGTTYFAFLLLPINGWSQLSNLSWPLTRWTIAFSLLESLSTLDFWGNSVLLLFHSSLQSSCGINLMFQAPKGWNVLSSAWDRFWHPFPLSSLHPIQWLQITFLCFQFSVNNTSPDLSTEI